MVQITRIGRQEERLRPLVFIAKNIGARVSQDVEASFILNKNHHTKAPCFDRDEIRLGNLLGNGSFSFVYEIEDISCSQKEESYSSEELSMRASTADDSRKKVNGKGPLVLKCLKDKFSKNTEKFIDAGHGLVMEAHFLDSLQHPHIISVRGWANQGSAAFSQGHDGFFIILDRLQATLDQRIREWSKQIAKYKTAVVKRYSQPDLQNLFLSRRFNVARDVASALAYLHAKGIIYRDLKPSNIGFDMKGKVKLFDFGLARELPLFRSTDEEFRMSGHVGTPRYMSPEVRFQEPYNEKADVYSFSLVMWEMLALERPFCYEKDGEQELQQKVVFERKKERRQRPKLDASWPKRIKTLLVMSWDDDALQRPKMSKVHSVLKSEIQRLKKDYTNESERK
mmetsp:Transcript_32759/g.75423  ORF Transcript_32759/g.75423 Transcript_32759/m.75423 type:complete len:396 (+) Transcript_32759:38-1225(+)